MIDLTIKDSLSWPGTNQECPYSSGKPLKYQESPHNPGLPWTAQDSLGKPG